MKKIKDWKKATKITLSFVAAFGIILVSTGIQLAINMGIKTVPDSPDTDFDSSGSDRLIYYFDLQRNGCASEVSVDLTPEYIQEQLQGTYDFIDGRYDCADFHVNTLIRLLLDFSSRLSSEEITKVKTTLLGFKYWMDQGGSDSMCYWSENHQILFAVEEYLVGQTYPTEIFAVDGKTGAAHKELAAERINAWMGQRFSYGFTEFYSNNYYPEDISAMANFIQFANDTAMVVHMKIVMDIMWNDLATQSFKYEGVDSDGVTSRTYYIFNNASGRMYSDNRMSDDTGNRLRRYIDFVIQPNETMTADSSWYQDGNGFFNCFKQMYQAVDNESHAFYQVPEAIKAIFDDPASEKIVKSSSSLNVEELVSEGLVGQANNQIMMQMGMEAFTNPEIIDNSIKYISKNKMFTSTFLNDFKIVNLWPLTAFHLLGAVSNGLHPSTDGKAIERANVYTYKTENYSMSTAQNYQPGEYSDQQSISSVNLSNRVSVFTSQPAKIARRSGTPTYWVGNGRQPYSVQEKNVNLTIYYPPTKTGLLEPMIVKETTHVFFPTQLFDNYDDSELANGYIFGQVGNSYIAIKSRYAMAFRSFEESSDSANGGTNRDDMIKRGSVSAVLTEKYDLVQTGPDAHYFLTELSGSDVETFASFKTRFMANVASSLSFSAKTLSYRTTLNRESAFTSLAASYGQSFSINDVSEDLEYPRFDNRYVSGGITLRKPSQIIIAFGGHTLTLDYAANFRLEETE